MKRNALTTAVSAALVGAVGMASIANADFEAPTAPAGIKVNPDGIGQVLLYPYYTTRGGNDTLVSLVNTSDQTVVAKVRFLEALNSREVLDFNIYMSPFDVWTAAVTEQDGVPGILTNDTTCTAPYIQGGQLDDDGEPVAVFQEFLNFEYATFVPAASDFRLDGGPTGIDRAGSGYLEVIEMGRLIRNPVILEETDDDDEVTFRDVFGVTLAGAVKHGSDRVPAACDVIQTLWTSPGTGSPTGTGFWLGNEQFGILPPAGALFGAGSVVNVANGTQFGFDAVALENFWADGETAHVQPGSQYPDLNGALSDTLTAGNTLSTAGASNTTAVWGTTIEAVSAALSKDAIFNEYVVGGIADARTEWVVTFPTKRFHTDGTDPRLFSWDGSFRTGTAIAPFTTTWTWVNDSDGDPNGISAACEPVSFGVWDREEQTRTFGESGPIVSPRPPGGVPSRFTLCREANVMRFSDSPMPEASEIFGEVNYSAGAFGTRGIGALNVTNFDLTQLGFESGWVNLELDGSGRTMETEDRNDDGELVQVTGLPVIGFSANTFFNGTAADTLRNYGSTFVHKGSRSILVSNGGSILVGNGE